MSDGKLLKFFSITKNQNFLILFFMSKFSNFHWQTTFVFLFRARNYSPIPMYFWMSKCSQLFVAYLKFYFSALKIQQKIVLQERQTFTHFCCFIMANKTDLFSILIIPLAKLDSRELNTILFMDKEVSYFTMVWNCITHQYHRISSWSENWC